MNGRWVAAVLMAAGVVPGGAAAFFEQAMAVGETGWQFLETADSMTGRTHCVLQRELPHALLAFRDDAFYIVSTFTLKTPVAVEARIDQHPAQVLPLQMVTPRIAGLKASPELTRLLDELRRGTTVLVRLPTLSGVMKETMSLTGFDAEYRKFQSCLAP